jgi:hypothetical protein
MPCIAAPKVPYPPGLSLLLPTIAIPSPSLGIKLCCTFKTPAIPGFPIILPLGQILPSGAAQAIQAVQAVIVQAVDQLNALLDQLTFDCPLE